ncbi:MAG TPA: peroxiredoxin-like family protein [Polyangiales bacterium]|nr:peroxiredoxin-like family protein [Polyangiales bacterium]
MPLQDELDRFRADFESKVPADALRIMHRSTASLISSRQAESALQVGDRAPSFDLPDPTGQQHASARLLAAGPLVVTFYRGVWCPYCNLELQALERARTEIEARGATLVAVSEQTAIQSRKSQRDNQLHFPILRDHGGDLADAFGIRWTLAGELKALYEQFGVDLPSINGEPSWTLPMPARYVIAQDGRIAYAEVNPDYTRRPEPSDVLPALDRLLRP